MKNFCIIFLTLCIIILTALGFTGSVGLGDVSSAEAEYLRIHIRADSNDAAAQAVKYSVRDDIVAYLTPLVANYETKAQAMEGIREKLSEIAAVASETLSEKGFSYTASAELKVEQFPTRIYGEYLLPAGEYSALIVNLGSGQGDNWWCVVYPPLCFANGTNVIYKSKILEIIQNFHKED